MSSDAASSRADAVSVGGLGDISVVTPSETVLLRPNELIGGQNEHRRRGPTPLFLGQLGIDPAPVGPAFHLVEDGPDLPCDAWALAVVTTALLALERRGWLTLEAREIDRWAGLSQREGLVVVPARRWPDGDRWPEPSLEWHLSRVSDVREVRDVVKDWLEVDSREPGQTALERMRDYLVERGLIEEVKVKRLRFFTASRYQLPLETAASIPAPSEAATLIAACERDRGDVWQALNYDARRGLMSRYQDPNLDHTYSHLD